VNVFGSRFICVTVSIKKNILFSAIGLICHGRRLEQKSAQKACAAGGEDFNQFLLKIILIHILLL
jgi:hypothetical protein